jgi:hypothetical protein
MHANFRVFEEEGFEEGKTHQVIPMPVGEQKIVLVAALFDQGVAQPANPRAGIDDDDIVALRPDFQACGVATILDVFASRYGMEPRDPQQRIIMVAPR